LNCFAVPLNADKPTDESAKDNPHNEYQGRNLTRAPDNVPQLAVPAQYLRRRGMARAEALAVTYHLAFLSTLNFWISPDVSSVQR
jgi:hypothetical protein